MYSPRLRGRTSHDGVLCYMTLDNSCSSNSDVFLSREIGEECPPSQSSNYFVPTPTPNPTQLRPEFRSGFKPMLTTPTPYSSDPTPTPAPTCSLNGGCDSNKMVFDPRTNLREAAKNMVLVEDHLTQEGLNCKDCISKHLLLIDAYLSEALGLDVNGTYRGQINDSLVKIRGVMREIKDQQGLDDESKRYKYAQDIRQIRKPLCINFACFV